VEKQYALQIPSVSSLSYPACGARAPYCRLCPAQLYNIFPHISHKARFAKTNIIELKMCFGFCIQFFKNISHPWRNEKYFEQTEYKVSVILLTF